MNDYGPFLGAVTGGASLISDAVGRKKGRKLARKEAKKNRRFQRRMASTQYQRGMKDMKKAGLNPILMASGGFGASAASGGMQAPTDQSLDVGAAMSSAQQGALLGTQLRKLKQEEKLVNQQATKEQALASKATRENMLLHEQLPEASAKANFYKSAAGKRAVVLREGGQAVAPMFGAAARLLPGMGVMK